RERLELLLGQAGADVLARRPDRGHEAILVQQLLAEVSVALTERPEGEVERAGLEVLDRLAADQRVDGEREAGSLAEEDLVEALGEEQRHAVRGGDAEGAAIGLRLELAIGPELLDEAQDLAHRAPEALGDGGELVATSGAREELIVEHQAQAL